MKSVTGITPAGAGKTDGVPTSSLLTQDHPRRCGENRHMTARNMKSPGSPPQVRGKLLGAKDAKLENRITPAGAGKTDYNSTIGLCRKDHPRRCGENQHSNVAAIPVTGSPPQVRGKPNSSLLQSRDNGITPAGAGKTSRAAL